uniref:Putative secreted protein n=1 Tax=Anopheles darlingi TaxID=43151 RepID=A0A2M4D0J4_ANODA
MVIAHAEELSCPERGLLLLLCCWLFPNTHCSKRELSALVHKRRPYTDTHAHTLAAHKTMHARALRATTGKARARSKLAAISSS